MRIRLPNGVILNAPDYADPAAVAKAYLAKNPIKEEAPAPAEEPQKPDAGFFGSFGEEFKSVSAAPTAVRYALAQEGSPEQTGLRKELIEKLKPRYKQTGLADVHDIGSAYEYAKEGLGGIAGSLSAAGLGSLATGLAGAPQVGFAGTLYAQHLAHNLASQAENQQAAIDEGKTPEAVHGGRAAIASAGQTALDVFGLKPFKMLTSKVPFLNTLFSKETNAVGEKLIQKEGETAEEFAKRQVESNIAAAKKAEDVLLDSVDKGKVTIKGGMLHGVGHGIQYQVPIQVAETALHRWQNGQSLADGDAAKDYMMAAANAGLLAIPLGAGEGYLGSNSKIQRAREIKEERAREEKAAQVEAEEKSKPAKATTTPTPTTQGGPSAEEVLAQPFVEGKPENEEEVGGENLTEEEIRDAEQEYLNEEREKQTAPANQSNPPTEASSTTPPSDVNTGTTGTGDGVPVSKSATDGQEVTGTDNTGVGGSEQRDAGLPSGEQRVGEALDANKRTVTTSEPLKDQRIAHDDYIAGQERSEAPPLEREVTGKREGEWGAEPPKDETKFYPPPFHPGRVVPEIVEALQQGNIGLAVHRMSYLSPTETIRTLARTLKESYVGKKTENYDPWIARSRRNELIQERTRATGTPPTEEEIQQFIEKYQERTGRNPDAEEEKRLIQQIKLKNIRATGDAVVRSEELAEAKRQFRISSGDTPNQFDIDKFVEDSIRKTSRKLTKEEIAEVEAQVAKETSDVRKGAPVELGRFPNEQELKNFRDRFIEKNEREPTPEEISNYKREFQRNGLTELPYEEAEERLVKSSKNAKTVEGRKFLKQQEGETDEEFYARRARNEEPRYAKGKESFGSAKVVLEGHESNTPQHNKRIEAIKARGRRAEYDPKTNTFYFTKEGLDERTIAHEMVHAATVRILRLVEKGLTENLDRMQVEAARHIRAIYEATLKNKYILNKYRMGEDSPLNNIYEFAAHATTNETFQRDLANISTPELAKYTKFSTARDLWSSFKAALAKLLGFTKTEGNHLLEVTEALEDIYAPPLKGTDVEPLGAAGKDNLNKIIDALRKHGDEKTPGEWSKVIEGLGLTKADGKPIKAGPYLQQLKHQGYYTGGEGAVRTLTGKTEPAADWVFLDKNGNPIPRPAPKPGATKPTKAAPNVTKAPPAEPAKTAEEVEEARKDDLREKAEESKPKGFFHYLFSKEGYSHVVRKLENYRRPWLELQRDMEKLNRLTYEGTKGFTDVYNQLSTMSGEIGNRITRNLTKPYEEVDASFRKLANDMGMTTEDTAAYVDSVMIAQHMPERRWTKWMFNAPLSREKNIRLSNGTLTSAADLRQGIIDSLISIKPKAGESKDTFEQRRKSLVASYRKQLENLVGHYDKYVDSKGVERMNFDGKFNPTKYLTPYGAIEGEGREGRKIRYQQGDRSVDPKSEQYDVLDRALFNDKTVADILRKYNENRVKYPELDKVVDGLRDISERTKELDREANFWTYYTDNMSELYNWQHYVPLKARPNVPEDERFELRSPRTSSELRSDITTGHVEGRENDPDNVIYRIYNDSVRAANRAGQHGVRQSLKNLIDEGGWIDAKKMEEMSFQDRFENTKKFEKYQANNSFLYYGDDGSVTLYRFKDTENGRKYRDAFMKPFQASSGALEKVTSMTQFLARQWTRYNPAFGGKNFVRDTFTNLGILSADKGIGSKYASAVINYVSKVGLAKSWNVAKLYHEGDTAKLDALAKKNPDYALLKDYLDDSSHVMYVAALTEGKTNQTKFLDSLENKPVSKLKKPIEAFADKWAGMFEFTTRAAAYKVAREEFAQKRTKKLEDKLGRKLNAAERKEVMLNARSHASAYAKNLANFENVGEVGRKLGAFYVFWRPSATGAVRAIDSLLPALQWNEKKLLEGMPKKFREELNSKDDKIRSNAERNWKDYLATHKEQRNRALAVMATFMGAGYALYNMSMGLAPADDEGRNLVKSDDMSYWTRNLRIPKYAFGGKGDEYVQLPWGLGAGGFMAFGAQLAGYMNGAQSTRDFIGNTVSLASENFLPLPIAKFNPLDPSTTHSTGFMAGFWLLDSVTPSAARPLLELLVDMDGLGRQVYHPSVNGPGYIASESVNELYNHAAGWMEDHGFSMNPRTAQYIMDNYLNAVSSFIAPMYNISLDLQGKKDFDFKRDTFLMNGFFGVQSNIDSRNFVATQSAIKRLNSRHSAIKDDPIRLDKFNAEHPGAEDFLDDYNKRIAALNKYQHELTQVKRDTTLSKSERMSMEQEADITVKLAKRQINEAWQDYLDAYGK